MATFCHAQKKQRHEVTIGWYGGYFFDKNETPYKFQALSQLPTITYNYHFKKKISIGLLYGRQQFGYYKKDYDWLNNSNKTLARSIRRFALNMGYDTPIKPLVLQLRLGAIYNNGIKLEHLYSFDHGTWLEVYQDYINYNHLGLSFGLTIQHPIVWHLFGEVSLDYMQMLSGVDRQQLMPSYRVGYKF